MEGPTYHYAVALFDIAKEERKVESYLDDASTLLKVINENRELIHLLSSYFLSEEEKNDIIEKSFSLLNENNFVNMIKLITKNHLISSIDDLLETFIELCNESLKVKKGIVYSTKPLNEDEIKKIQSAFDEKLSIKVELVNNIDESLIGGIRVIIDDHIYDSSLKNQLESLKSSLKREG